MILPIDNEHHKRPASYLFLIVSHFFLAGAGRDKEEMAQVEAGDY